MLGAVWHSGFGVDIKTLASWGSFEEYRDLRHLLVHRLGAWQPGIDRPYPSLTARLHRVAVNPDAYRGEVPMDAADLGVGIDSVLQLVTEADGRLP